MTEIRVGDFYYCESDWLSTNHTRVFRLNNADKTYGDELFFYPMEDIAFDVRSGYNTYFSNMKLATYDEIFHYISNVIDIFKSVDYVISSFEVYVITDEQRENFRRMEVVLNKYDLFDGLIQKYSPFGSTRVSNQWDTYSKEDKFVLNLFRAYYEYRLVQS